MVCVGTPVGLAVKLVVGAVVGVSGSGVRVGREVADERITGVGVPWTGGVGKKVETSASRIKIPMPIGMAYLRSIDVNGATGLVGGSPVYANAASRLFRLSK